MIHREPLVKHHETLKTLWNITKHLNLEHSSFDATISALDAETSALGAAMLPIGAAMSAIARSWRWYRRGVFGDIGDCGDSITPQMCNRVTNHGDMGTFSKQDGVIYCWCQVDLLTSINKCWQQVDPPMWWSRPLLLIKVGAKLTCQCDSHNLY